MVIQYWFVNNIIMMNISTSHFQEEKKKAFFTSAWTLFINSFKTIEFRSADNNLYKPFKGGKKKPQTTNHSPSIRISNDLSHFVAGYFLARENYVRRNFFIRSNIKRGEGGTNNEWRKKTNFVKITLYLLLMLLLSELKTNFLR